VAFCRRVCFSEPLPTIEGDGVYLRAPQMSDYSEWTSLREASRAFLTPWEPTWPSDDLSRSAFRRRLRRYAEDQRMDTSYAFFLFRKSDETLVGGLTVANIRRGVAQAGSLGYWIGEPFARRGLMSGAVQALVPFGFGSLRLHRLEAACIPTNTASSRLGGMAGVAREGSARAQRWIQGPWRDRQLGWLRHNGRG